MKKKWLLVTFAALLILAGAVSAGAQARLEGNLTWPVTAGISSSSTFVGGSSIDLSQFHLLFPDFRAYYQFGNDFLHGGIGVRVPTLIIVSAIYPDAFIEMDLQPAPVVLQASLGGLLFGAFGYGVASLTVQPYVIPDLNASLKIAPWFRLGGGVEFLMPFNGTWQNNFIYVVYLSARFVFVIK